MDRYSNANIGFFIIDYSSGGGVERVTANLMREFSEQGFQHLYLISLKADNQQPAMSYPAVKDLKILGRKKGFAEELGNYLKQQNIQHLIFQGDNMTIGLEVLKAAKLANCKAYPQYHGSPYAYLRKYPDAEHANLLKRLLASIVYPFKKSKLRKFIQSSPQGLFCVSNGSADELKHLFRGENTIDNKIKVIHNPILLNERIASNKQNRITLVSRLESRHKNAFLALKAWELIAEKYPNWRLVILGSGGLESKMKKYCERYNVKNVDFKGFVKNVEAELALSKISINVSNCEGFSMAIAEAITQGNAIAITDSDGGIRDMGIHYETALVSPKNDAQDLAKHIAQLIEDNNLMKRLSENAYENLRQMTLEEKPSSLWIKMFAS